MATRKPKPTVSVDAGDLAAALNLIAANTAPNTVLPSVARAVLDLEHALAPEFGALDIGWGLRAGDKS